MEFLTEFYLTTLWTYKSKIVREVIEDMAVMGFAQAEFTYDSEFSWFKVTCRKDDADVIRYRFGLIAREVEKEAFEACEDDLLHMDDTLMSSFDNEWFSQQPGDASSSAAGETDELYCRPEPLAKYPFVETWDDLDKHNEFYTIMDIMDRSDADLVEKELDISYTAGLAGKLVHIAGQSKESISKARERLLVALAIKKLQAIPSWAEHVVYAENQVDVGRPGFTADIRYLANIDPKLASSTLIDRLMVEELADSYKTIYREASSIRICPWAADKQCYVSLFGPAVAVRPRDRTVLGNKPAITTRMIEKVNIPASEPSQPAHDQVPQASNQVESWIETVPVHEESVRHAAHYLLDTQAVPRPSAMPADYDLLEFLEDETTLCPGTPSAAISEVARNHRIADAQIPTLCPDFPALQPGTSSVETMANLRRHELGFTGDDCLIDMLAAVDTTGPRDAPRSSISWGMPSLIPLPTDNANGDGKDDSGEQRAAVGSSMQNRNPGSAPHMDQRRPQQGTSAESNLSKGVAAGKHETTQQADRKTSHSHGLAAPGAQSGRPPALDAKTGGSDQLLATENFVKGLEAAMARLLSVGPYRRGRVAVRAEFGRIILEKVDGSGLAFNNVNTPSDGWEEAALLRNLKAGYGRNRDIHFTKILSTYAYDIEDMINTKTNGARLWEQQPSRVWTTYSFHCALRSEKNDMSPFIVDVEDGGIAGIEFSYSIRPQNDVPGADKPMPIYVHAICRHWDLRIVTSRVKTDEMEKTFGAFANDLMQSLSVLCNEKGLTELQFAVPAKSPADVKEVRVLTKWRYASLDKKSALEITEVQQLKTEDYSEGPYSDAAWYSYAGKRSRPWPSRLTQENRNKGEVPRWYEAAVVSLELEKLCQQNALLKIGEKADWDAQELRVRGIFPAIYGPALQMVRLMDHVGRLDDNHLSQLYGGLLLRHNFPLPQVPGQ
ncbi:hypothetical protein C8A01DRAFT_14141 [Parachaetomium inaequale]|uniref:DUF7905 domain-containing protein n=1 Tax=Parachaetomium inaequale TaxID=2588326 RepID=A0AAN6PJU1_9PEZI|nr:hypothetical protein C8A01DRAFT_14141 [Parachaetomium inaequale]